MTLNPPEMIFGKKAAAVAMQYVFMQGAQFAVDLGPYLPKLLSQNPGVTVAQQGSVGVVVEHDPIRPPTHRHRESGVEDHVQH
jgi:hypothetical protein